MTGAVIDIFISSQALHGCCVVQDPGKAQALWDSHCPVLPWRFSRIIQQAPCSTTSSSITPLMKGQSSFGAACHIAFFFLKEELKPLDISSGEARISFLKQHQNSFTKGLCGRQGKFRSSWGLWATAWGNFSFTSSSTASWETTVSDYQYS